ncbi:hypothetical protein C9374_009269 [Naegleria lovaniensis]|uniref:Uncharacterized protein n=1 Tax=Naegleria lovaniensis TaxID=51637 RepID=A0AA88GF63_NAELO|nr:uncharacterized protein C9374_009269 [Naegleria lovaniensis]KAG2377358.1 hypothetical protein C9374_009269 [Naegleria lovaniensis]
MQYIVSNLELINQQCPNIVKVYKYSCIKNEESFDIKAALYSLMICRLKQDNIVQQNSTTVFEQEYLPSTYEVYITQQELLQELNLKPISSQITNCNLDFEKNTTTKVLLIVKWIGHCMKILTQLHEVLDVMHGNISLGNVMTRTYPHPKEKLDSTILNTLSLDEAKILKPVVCRELVVTDLNNSYLLEHKLEGDDVRDISEHNQFVIVAQYPYSHIQQRILQRVQGDIYSMAIFIAKLVKEILFNDEHFLDPNVTHDYKSFTAYRCAVLEFFKTLSIYTENDNITIKSTQLNHTFFSGLFSLLDYMLNESVMPSKSKTIYESDILEPVLKLVKE